MAFSQDFFNQRSFEVVWATFRVAEYAQREKIRRGLEDRALDYIIYKDQKTLSALEEIVRLAQQIGEISKVNAVVLLREIENLRGMIGTSAPIGLLPEKQAEAHTAESAPSIEEIFSKPPMTYKEFTGVIKDNLSTNKRVEESKPPTVKNENKTEVNTEKRVEVAKNSIVEQKEEIKTENKQAGRGTLGGLPVGFKSKEILQKEKRVEAEIKNGIHPPHEAQESLAKSGNAEVRQDDESISFRDRQDKIMALLQKRTLCHINDVMREMPQASPRTLRYDIQRLVDSGIVERVGSGGPNSFFRLKGKEIRG